MNEEVIIRMGMDTLGIETGLRDMRHKLKEFGNDMAKDIFGPLSLAAGVALIESAMSRVQGIQRAAEGLGISTDFIQDLRNVAGTAGIAGDQVEKMMAKFAKGLTPGSDIEKEFYALADSIAQTEDPVKRVQMAVEAFGEKLGPKFISTLAKGSAGIRELAGEFSKFSKTEIQSLEEAHIAMERFENGIVISAGRMLASFQLFWKGLSHPGWEGVNFMKRGLMKFFIPGGSTGDEPVTETPHSDKAWVSDTLALIKYKEHLNDLALRSKAMNFDEKIALLEKHKAYQEHAAERAKGDDELYGIATKIADTEAEILNLKKEQNDEIQKALDEGEKQLDQDKKHAEHLQRAAKDAKEDVAARAHQNSGVTLQDLANAPWQMFNNGIQGWRGPTAQSQAAQRILQLRAWAHQNAIAGNIPLAEAQSGEAERINTALEKFNPFLGDSSRKVERHSEETALALKQFLAGHPMVVQGAEGP